MTDPENVVEAGNQTGVERVPGRSVVLIVMDGWGFSSVYEGNAIAQASTPTFDRLWKSYPHTLLQAAGEAVGLPWGEMGNSEVGHLNIGAGHTVPQDLPRISTAVADGTFFENKALVAACDHVNETGGRLHLIGLASTGGVHSHIRHLYALLRMARKNEVKSVVVHAFTDGRDAPPKAGLAQIAKLEAEMQGIGLGRIATVGGRYYGLDRDKHWDRVRLAYDAIALGEGPTAPDAQAAISAAYDAGQTDEFIVPTVIVPEGEQPVALEERDAVIFFNFRPDRVRQLTEAFVRSDFREFDRKRAPVGVHFVTMTRYEESFPVHVAFQPQNVDNTLAQVLSDHGIRQFHIAETEKYPHATFFFNGGIENPYPLEERLLVPSPKVPTYDQAPAMSAREITDELVKRIESEDYPFIMVNYANPDMVGHSGDLAATVSAVEAVDNALGRVVSATAESGSFLLITADHGNAEQMVDFTSGQIDTEHTTNPVPFVLVIPPKELSGFSFDEGKLSLEPKPVPTGILGDVAPTILDILGVEKPDDMAGYGLL